MNAIKLRRKARHFREIYRNMRRRPALLQHLSDIDAEEPFDFDTLKVEITDFVDAHAIDGRPGEYLFSKACHYPTLYGSVYACLTRSMLGDLKTLDADARAAWIEHLDSFAAHHDGLFYDPIVDGENYRRNDWWGARHIALHVVASYTALGGRPPYPLRFLNDYKSPDAINSWLASLFNSSAFDHASAIDNQIMNIGCLLQFDRDFMGDHRSGVAVEHLKSELKRKLRPDTGMWGDFNLRDPEERSRAIQFAYHLFPIFFYDRDFGFNASQIVDSVLSDQTVLGGFGVQLNSSACEDIDSIDILTRFHPYVDASRQERIDAALKQSLRWVLACRGVDSGGFVFRLLQDFNFGHPQTSAPSGVASMMPTWFRTLSLLFLSKHLCLPNAFILNPCPGYEY